MYQPSNKDLLNWVMEGLKEKVSDFTAMLGDLKDIASEKFNVVKGMRGFFQAIAQQSQQPQEAQDISRYGVLYLRGLRPLTDARAMFALRENKEVFAYVKGLMGDKDEKTGKRRMSFAQAMKGKWPEELDWYRWQRMEEENARTLEQIKTRDVGRRKQRGDAALLKAQAAMKDRQVVA